MNYTLLKNAIVVTVNPQRDVFFEGAVLFGDGRLAYVGPMSELDAALEQRGLAEGEANHLEVIDVSGKVLFPGFINTHNHLYQTMLKGCGDDLALADWLATMTFPASASLDPESAYYGGMIGLMEGVRSGVTTNLDYMYPHPREGLTDPIIKAYRETGVRCVMARGGMDSGIEFGVDPRITQTKEQVERDLVRLFDTYHMKDDGNIRIWTAPAALWSNSDEMLRMLWDITTHYRTGFTCHISETPFDRASTLKQHGMTELEYLEARGMVGKNVLMVHCVYLTAEDIEKAVQYGMTISHNVASNMYLSSGVAPVPQMLEKGLHVSLGLDGAASNNGQDMLELMKLTSLLQKVHTLDPTIISAEKVLEMATIDGARALMMDDEIGSLEEGKRADIVICKLSGNWPDTVATAKRCLEHGADGLCAIDSIGPTLKIDIRKARPEMMSNDGYGWLTGEAIRPIVMRINSEIARNHRDFPNLYASGGCTKAEDVVEFFMAGAHSVGLCTAPILKGIDYITKLRDDLKKLLAELGYASIDAVWQKALPHFPETEHVAALDFDFQPYQEDGVKKKCISCHRCEVVCCYEARKLDFPEMHVDRERCRNCGLCVDVCPTGALTSKIAAQTEQDRELERRSKAFDKSVS